MTEARVDSDPRDQGPRKTNPQTDDGFGGAAQTARRASSPRVPSVSAERNTGYRSAKPQLSGTVRTKHAAPELTTEELSTARDAFSAATGTKPSDAKTNPPVTSTSVPGAEKHRTELSNAVLQRRLKLLTPLIANQWEHDLYITKLHTKYPQIPEYIRHGAHAGIPQIHQSYTPLNKKSTESLAEIFNEMIHSEFAKGRYIGPFSQEQLERKIGPFQSSPLSLVPKAGKPGKYRLIQNLSHPHTNQPIPSINAQLNSDNFPCTWGTFQTMCALIRHLPRGAQAATRDISEAYRIIPLHENQWAVSNNPRNAQTTHLTTLHNHPHRTW